MADKNSDELAQMAKMMKMALHYREAAPPPVPITWSFDSGLADPVTFPIADLTRLTGGVLAGDAAGALEYGSGIANIMYGYEGLRDRLAARVGEIDGRKIDRGSIILTSGATQGITMTVRALVDPGDIVIVEAPTWGWVLAEAHRAGAQVIAIPMDADGMRMDLLELELARLAGEGRRAKLLYTIATFNTPTGWSLSEARRRRLIALAEQWDFFVLEDNVYGDLRYDGARIPTLFGLDRADRVIRLDSFSKTVAAGLRLGWLTAPAKLAEELVPARGDLGVSQWLSRSMDRFLTEGLYDPHVAKANQLYRRKRDAAVAALKEHCGNWVSFAVPDGGFFLWLEIAPEIDGAQVMQTAMANGVQCRPGERFFGEASEDKHKQFLRLAFSMVPISELERGIAMLGKAMAASMR